MSGRELHGCYVLIFALEAAYRASQDAAVLLIDSDILYDLAGLVSVEL